MILLFLCATLLPVEVFTDKVGGQCIPIQLQQDIITEGECVLVSDCEGAVRAIHENLTHSFSRCGFHGVFEIICCPKQLLLNSPAPIETTTKADPVSNQVPLSSNSKTPPKKKEIFGEIGDSCKPTRDTSDGECVLVTECEVALRQISETLTHPYTRCGFKGKFELICCPKQSSLATRRPAYSKRPTLNFDENARPIVKHEDLPAPNDAYSTKPVLNTVQTTTPEAKVPLRVADKQCEEIKKKTLPPFSIHVVGGEAVGAGEFPHMVALGYQTNEGLEFRCGAALISENFLVTAAHCTNNPLSLKPTTARIGVVDIGGGVFNPETDIEIAEIIIHPKYSPRQLYNDIALLRLSKPVTYSRTIIPACLYTGESLPNVTFTVTGWGRTDYIKDDLTKTLQKANVAHASQELCKANYSIWRKLPSGVIDSQFCAGGGETMKDTCQGDSGGPLQGLTDPDGRYRIIGITSFGRGCGSVTPGVYTKISAFLDFIESVVWPN